MDDSNTEMYGKSTQHTPAPVVFGEVLFDVFPDGNKVLGGAPFNVAWHLKGFGLDPLFISRVGNDEHGKEILDAMSSWGMTIKGMQIDADHRTGVVDVSITDNQPSYTILEDVAYDFIDTAAANQCLEQSQHTILYHGTLILRNKHNRDTLSELLALDPTHVFLDINLRSPWWNIETVSECLSHTTWLKLNEHELALIQNLPDNDVERARNLLHQHSMQALILTLGEKGASIINGTEIQTERPPTITHFVDSVGAGDAFSSVCILGLIQEWSTSTILERAQAFASRICENRGAVIDDKQFYNQLMKEWTSS